MPPQNVDVVVVGAGPSGLALACTLRQGGADVLVLEQAAEGAGTSRAAVVHARTLEVLERLDVSRRMVAAGRVVPAFTVRAGARVLMRLDFGDLPTAYPYALMLPQSRTEAILAERLAQLGGDVWRPYAVTGVTGTRAGAAVAVAGPDGSEQTVHARYVVGADGMHSAVRSAAGIGFAGGRYEQSFVLADVRMDWPLSPREVQLYFAPEGLVVVAPLPDGHHRVVATLDDAPEEIGSADVQALLDERTAGGALVRELAWSSRFRVHHRVADAYRRGPIFLVGDAAHVHSPAGGQGMNIGIQDAVDLGTAMLGALAGSGDAALDGYEQRRRPVAQRVVALTDRATRVATVRGAVARAGRDAALSLIGRIPAVQHRLALQLAELPAAPERAAAVQRYPVGSGGSPASWTSTM
jgi:2-polyprenyl-6-methoxyphenol hydroxylase-like FAD-dependent oxidoreductase